MQSFKKFRPEAEVPASPPTDMEKDIVKLKSLRKMRLTKKEKEYKNKKQDFIKAQENFDKKMKDIQNLQEKNKEEKQQLKTNNIEQIFQPHELLQWVEYEHKLDDTVQQLIKELMPLQQKVDAALTAEAQAKKIFREAQLGIEKLDILEEELKKENV